MEDQRPLLRNQGSDQQQPRYLSYGSWGRVQEPIRFDEQFERITLTVRELLTEAYGQSTRFLALFCVLWILEMTAATYVLVRYWKDPCDTAFKVWIVGMLTRIPPSAGLAFFKYYKYSSNRRAIVSLEFQMMEQMLSIMSNIWFIVGQFWILSASHCAIRMSPMRIYCLVFSFFYIFLIAFPFALLCTVCMCLPCLLFVLRFFPVDSSGISTEGFNNLNRIVYGRGGNNSSGNSEMCAICREDFVQGDQVIKLSCSHVFHAGHIESWLRIKAQCPLCREPVLEAMV